MVKNMNKEGSKKSSAKKLKPTGPTQPKTPQKRRGKKNIIESSDEEI